VSLCIVVGGQYGSEGKGKITAALAKRRRFDIAIRCGGPNSGHTFVGDDGNVVALRHVSTAFVDEKCRLLIPAGAAVDLAVLRSEIRALGLSAARIGVDRNAMIIERYDKEFESAANLHGRLSSTLSGVGAATSRRVLRSNDVRLAADAARTEPWLAEILTDVSMEANAKLDANGSVLIEGTQGFGLSLFHSDHYPKTTSKDTTAASFLAEVGVSPLRVTDILLVFRTFPIRVHGPQAGPLKREIDWETLRIEAGAPYDLSELTTVTKQVRRVARFDWDLAKRAVLFNRPTGIAINGIDHLNYGDHGVEAVHDLSEPSRQFMHRLRSALQCPISFVGTGPKLSDLIVLSDASSEATRARPIPRELAS
jgi:adenylosuccinate synthase